jgi:hypothetical protein
VNPLSKGLNLDKFKKDTSSNSAPNTSFASTNLKTTRFVEIENRKSVVIANI